MILMIKSYRKKWNAQHASIFRVSSAQNVCAHTYTNAHTFVHQDRKKPRRMHTKYDNSLLLESEVRAEKDFQLTVIEKDTKIFKGVLGIVIHGNIPVL